jgi:hypothetical protein
MVQKANQNEATHAQDSQDLMLDTTASLTLEGCVCPQCFKPLKAPSVTESPPDRYGIKLRSYAAMCFTCGQACKVIQFEADGKWIILSYRIHLYESGRFFGYGDWITVNPLPEPPAVMTGPGGDYDKVPDLSGELALPLLRSASGMMSKVAHTIRELLEVIEKLQRNEPDKRKH